MTKRLFLHIGMPKCATTTVQAYLARYAGDLARHGFQYDLPRRFRVADQGNGARLSVDLMEGPLSESAADLDFFLRGERDVILSSEFFWGLSRNPGKLQEMIAHIAAAGYETKVICFLRRQDLWIESDYKQHVKDAVDWRGNLGDLLRFRLSKRVLHYTWMLNRWAGVVGTGNIHVVPMRSGQAPEYPVRMFLRAIGAEEVLRPEHEIPLRNISPPTGLIEPARYLKKALLDKGLTPEATAEHVTAFFAGAPKVLEVPSRRFLLPYERRAAMMRDLAPMNSRLSETYMGGDSLFLDPPEKDPASEAPLAREAAEVLAAWQVADVRG